MADENDKTRALYAVLGVPVNASSEEIKVAYRRLALLHHPDRKRQKGETAEEAQDAAFFARIAFAYEVLGNPQRRKRYDISGELPQSDSALGKEASQTFLAEYIKSAPTIVRGVTNADMSLHSLENYEVIDVQGRDVPEYMRAIVSIGLGYLVSVVEDMAEKEVTLLRHFVMDQMYLLIAYKPPLDAEAFAERGYVITYYDHPLQSGIKPAWSDQNVLGGRGYSQGLSDLKNIDEKTIERRKLVALEWFGQAANEHTVDPIMAIPGEGTGPERLQLAVQALVKAESDPMSFDIHRLRRDLERRLNVEPHSLDSHGALALTGLVMEAIDAMEDEENSPPNVKKDSEEEEKMKSFSAKAVGISPPSFNAETGAKVLVLATGRVGEVVLHDPDDANLTYKVKFSDGQHPEFDWCSAVGVGPAAQGA